MLALPKRVVKHQILSSASAPGLGAGALDDGEADVHHSVDDRPALGAIDDEAGRLSADPSAINADGRERRMGVRREGEVAFFFNDTATTEIYTLSLHDARPALH